MRVIYMGTSDFAVPALESLVTSGHEIVAVYTKEPKPAGQHLRMRYSPVYKLAQGLHIPIFTPKTFKDPEEVRKFQAIEADLAVVCAYGLILPEDVLKHPKMGCWNIHASLLPRWRGAAPIQRAIQAGDTETGVTIMQMDNGVDTGDILSQVKVAITPDMTGGELHDVLAVEGAKLLLKTMEEKPTPQKQAGESLYANKLAEDDLFLDWNMRGELVHNAVRAFCPYPGKRVYANEFSPRNQLKLYKTEFVNIEHSEAPGTVLDDQLLVACATGAVRILELQRPGKEKQRAEDFLNGTSIPKGSKLLGVQNLSFFLGLDSKTSLNLVPDVEMTQSRCGRPEPVMYKRCNTKLR